MLFTITQPNPFYPLGTPHTFHYTGAVLALTAGKHVLCEKPFTSNAAELHALIALAKEKNVFLMEAMWTRFQPVALKVAELIQTGSLGDIRVVHADLAGDFDIESESRYTQTSVNQFDDVGTRYPQDA